MVLGGWRRVLAYRVFFYSWLGCLVASGLCLADEDPSAVREGYDPEKTAREKWDPLKREYSVNEGKNKGGLFAGGKVAFGQAYPTEPDSDPGLFYRYGAELGYVLGRGQWNRIQIGGEFYRGKAEFRLDTDDSNTNIDFDVSIGLLVSAGYGYSLGGNVFGLLTVGAGPVFGDLAGRSGGVKFKAADSLDGIYLQVGWVAYVPIGDTLEFFGGLEYGHLETDVGEIKSNGITSDYDKPIVFNIPQAMVGLRLVL